MSFRKTLAAICLLAAAGSSLNAPAIAVKGKTSAKDQQLLTFPNKAVGQIFLFKETSTQRRWYKPAQGQIRLPKGEFMLIQLSEIGCDDLSWLKNVPAGRIAALDFTQVDRGDEVLRAIAYLKNLKSLDLTGLRVTDSGLANLSGIEHLDFLNLSETDISGTGLKKICPVTRLHIQRLSLSDAGVAALPQVRGLKTLAIGWNRLNRSQFDTISRLTALTHLEVPFCGITDQLSPMVFNRLNLTCLDLRGNDIKDAGVRALSKMSQLQILNLSRTGISDASLTTLKHFPMLSYLSISNCSLSSPSARYLEPLRSLATLDYSSTKIDDAAMPHLAKLKNLKTLYLTDTKITGKGAHLLCSIPGLHELALSDTLVDKETMGQLKKCLPTCIITGTPALPTDRVKSRQIRHN